MLIKTELASLNPAALDQACIKLVYAAPDSMPLIEHIESRNGIHILEQADEIGFSPPYIFTCFIGRAEAKASAEF